MAETRQIRGMTIHFLGDNAAQLAKSFDGSLAGSQLFRDAMNETARTQRHIYAGSSLDDLRDQPDFDRAGFDTNSERRRNTSAFGHASGADSYFVVITDKAHHLFQNGKVFPGSTDLSVVHEFLHPSQVTRTFAESGKLETDESETRVQLREQKIAEELGWKPGIDFPDVFESGPYGVKLDSPQVQPAPAPNRVPAPPVDPTSYEGGAPAGLKRPIFLQQPDDWSAPRLVNTTAPAANAALRNPNSPASSPEPDGLIGFVSGKPMRFPFAPIFDTQGPPGATGDPNRSNALDDLISNLGRGQAPSLNADAAPPVPNRRIASIDGLRRRHRTTIRAPSMVV